MHLQRSGCRIANFYTRAVYRRLYGCRIRARQHTCDDTSKSSGHKDITFDVEDFIAEQMLSMWVFAQLVSPVQVPQELGHINAFRPVIVDTTTGVADSSDDTSLLGQQPPSPCPNISKSLHTDAMKNSMYQE